MIDENCDLCKGTGYYGDNGPGIKGNNEHTRCECRTYPKPNNEPVSEISTDELIKHYGISQRGAYDLIVASRLESQQKKIDELEIEVEYANSNYQDLGNELDNSLSAYEELVEKVKDDLLYLDCYCDNPSKYCVKHESLQAIDKSEKGVE